MKLYYKYVININNHPMFRITGNKLLQSVIDDPVMITSIESGVFDYCNIENEYKNNLYQIFNDIINGRTCDNILDDISNGRIGWNNVCFKTIQDRIKEQDEFIENPFEVEEGAIECKAFTNSGGICGSKRIISYSKQIRSCDEPTTTFATCCKCGSKWVYNG